MSTKRTLLTGAGLLALTLTLTGCVTDGTPTLGKGGTVVSGSAGESGGSQGQSAQLPRCDQRLGTIALVEEQNPGLAQAGLTSPIPLLRLMVQQSGCFAVVDRGQAFTRMQEERAIATGGNLQAGSNVGGGQMAAADYYLTPNIIFQDENAGRAGGGMGALLPGWAGVVAGAISVQTLQAEVMLTLTDTRTGIQEIAAQGSAQKKDIGFAFGGGGLGALPIAGVGGAYASTDIGKITAAALLDGYAKVVEQARVMPAIQARLKAPQATAMAAVSPTGTSVAKPAPGTSYTVSVDTLNLRGGPDTTAQILGKLAKGDTVQATGEAEGQWYRVQTASGQNGWVSARSLKR